MARRKSCIRSPQNIAVITSLMFTPYTMITSTRFCGTTEIIDGFPTFTNEMLLDYRSFHAILHDFQRFYKLESYTVKEIDQYLWQLGKANFPKKYWRCVYGKRKKEAKRLSGGDVHFVKITPPPRACSPLNWTKLCFCSVCSTSLRCPAGLFWQSELIILALFLYPPLLFTLSKMLLRFVCHDKIRRQLNRQHPMSFVNSSE